MDSMVMVSRSACSATVWRKSGPESSQLHSLRADEGYLPRSRGPNA